MAFPNSQAIAQPEDDRKREDRDYIRVDRVYKVPIYVTKYTRDQLQEQEFIPDTNATDIETRARYEGYEWEPEQSGSYSMLIIRYVRRLERTATYDLVANTYEAPLEDLAGFGFKMAWKYVLMTKDKTKATVRPSWYATAVDPSDTSTDTDYTWTRSATPTGKYEYFVDTSDANLKSGVVNYLKPSSVVTKRKVYNDYNLATAWATRQGTYMAPADNFGISSAADDWLVRDVRIIEDFTAWVVTVEFLYFSGGVDTDIYSASGATDDA
jgi:hypothetical protein